MPQRPSDHSVLATDLDGTFIPLAGNEENVADLRLLEKEFAERGVILMYVTGRHFELTSQAIEEHRLPQPDWLICDVGTSIYHRPGSGYLEPVSAYRDQLDAIIAPLPIGELRETLKSIEGLRLQEEEKQGPFKLSYYAEAAQLKDLVRQIEKKLTAVEAPYSVISSVDPFRGEGLIDLLPEGVSKAYALAWWVDFCQHQHEAVVFAGDTGNDFAALTAGYRAIVVGNADRAVAHAVYERHREQGWENRLFLAERHATSGVLEGCRWFGLLPTDPPESTPAGATPLTVESTAFRVWAPHRDSVSVQLESKGETFTQNLTEMADGFFTGVVENAGPGAKYRYLLDGQVSRPDPVSRFQPEGVHGPSQVVNPMSYPWTDRDWRGLPKQDLIIYELHVGAFTREGTFRSAIRRLPELLELGVTAVELMPVVQTPGRWNWGYDGVDLFAVRNTYGRPDDFKAFVDACHAAGLAVILDVVYNHLGPEGNYLSEYGPYASTKHLTPWGDAFNFDEEQAEQVRKFVIDNALFWLQEYHLDGLRLDAAHFILDESDPTVLDEMSQAVTEFAGTVDREIHLIAETNVFDREILEHRAERPGFAGIWCDCLMHSIYSVVRPDLRFTRREYLGTLDLAESLQFGYIYSGADELRLSESPRPEEFRREGDQALISSLVLGLQTHDGVGNHPCGLRFHQLTSKALQRAAAGLTLLYPGIPLMFMGEESAVDAPFPFFVDFEDPRLRRVVDEAKREEHAQHPEEGHHPPSSPETFQLANCDREGINDPEMLAWYRALIALRKQGLAEGWLAPERMTAEFDAARSVYTLKFQKETGGQVVVQARIAKEDPSESETVELAIEGEVLLSSENLPEPIDRVVTLKPNHVVISQTTP